MKLFLSSTFNEMREQRDYFRNEINTEVNQIVGQVGKNLYLYDFELGISKDKSFTDILDFCFHKIDESEYFVAIFENNYGTHINKGFEDRQETYYGKYGELVSHGIQRNLSVLELESIKSLDNLEQKKLFFIKNESSNREANLRDMITRIEASTVPNVKIFHYSEPENILAYLKQYFTNEVKNEIEKIATDEQKNRNLVYANKTRYYVSNNSTQKILNELDDYVNNDSRKIFVLSSEAGSGKRTALLQWIKKQEGISDTTQKIIPAFAGIEGNTISDILSKIYNQVSTNDNSSINEDEETLIKKFAPFTLEVSEKFSKTIVIIDGINQLKFVSEFRKYWWLNKQLEHNIKVIVSTTDEVADTHFEIHTILPQYLPELIKKYLCNEGKEQVFDDIQEKRLFEDVKIIPAFARLLCTEICMVENHKTIDDTLNKYKDKFSTDILLLYRKFLKRLEERPSLKTNSIVQEICRFIYYSENGLSIDTLKQLLKGKEKQVDTFNSLLYNYELIRGTDDRVKFSTDYFRQAVVKFKIKEDNKDVEYGYIDDNTDEKAYRTAIIDVLENSKDAKKKENIAERAYQISQLKDKQKMYELLSDIDNAEKLYDINRVQFRDYLNLANDNKSLYWDNLYWKYSIKVTHSPIYASFIAQYCHEIANYEYELRWRKTVLKIYKYNIQRILSGNKNIIYEARLYDNVGNVYTFRSDYTKALKYYQKASKIREKELSYEHPDVASSFNKIGLVYTSKGDYSKALEFHQKSLNILEKLWGNKHPNVVETYNYIATACSLHGNYPQAFEYYQKALNIQEKVLGNEHPDVAKTYNNIGEIYCLQSKFSEAFGYFQKAKDIQEKLFGSEHPEMARTYINYASYYNYQGNYPWALDLLQKKALKIQEKFLGNKHSDVATTHNNIGIVYMAQGDYSQALESFQKALNIQKNVLGNEHPHVATTYNNIGAAYDSNGYYFQAQEYYQKALDIQQKMQGNEHPDVAKTYNNFGASYKSHGDYSQALEYLFKALKLWKKVLGNEHPNVAIAYSNIGEVFYSQGNYSQALDYHQKALKIREKVFGNEHLVVSSTYYNLGVVSS